MDATIPYQDFKRQFLERLGCTEAKARQVVWRNLPTEQQSPRAHLSLIIRGINRLAVKVKDEKDQIMEIFNGVLALYYSSEFVTLYAGRSIPAFTRWSTRWRLLGNQDL